MSENPNADARSPSSRYNRDSGSWVPTVSAEIRERPTFTGTKMQVRDEAERAKKRLAELKQQIATSEQEKALCEGNPSPQNLATFHILEAQIAELRKKVGPLEHDLKTYQKILEDFEDGAAKAAPLVEHIRVLYDRLTHIPDALAQKHTELRQIIGEHDGLISGIKTCSSKYTSLAGEPPSLPLSAEYLSVVPLAAREYALSAPSGRLADWPRPEKTPPAKETKKTRKKKEA
jgi:hypothetical protein